MAADTSVHPTSAPLRGRRWRTIHYHQLVVASLMALLLLPIAATLVYSLSSRWGATILPDGFSLGWYLQLWSEPRFLAAFARSLLVCAGTLVLNTRS